MKKVNLFVTDEKCILVDENEVQSYKTDAEGLMISLPMSVQEADGRTQITIDLTDTKRLANSKQKLSAAKQIMTIIGFSPEIIDFTPDEKKIELTTGLELGITYAMASPSGKDENSYGGWSSILTYTRKSMNYYYFTNTGKK